MVRYSRSIRMAVACAIVAIAGAGSKLTAQVPAAAPDRETGWIWIEQFGVSSNTYGQIAWLNSRAGYQFNSHASLTGGVPVYFVRNSAANLASADGIGDAYLGLQLAWATPIVNYRMGLFGAAPTGDSSKGLGVGHASYDWSHHLDRSFGRLTPFIDAGLANAIPQIMFVQRQFESYGHAAHFEFGSSLRLIGPLSASVSGYDIEPWGTQTVFSRVVTRGGPPAGAGRNGRVFELSQAVTGGSALARDRGVNAGANVSVGRIELWGGYSRSNSFDLNTFSFGMGVNLSSLLRRTW